MSEEQDLIKVVIDRAKWDVPENIDDNCTALLRIVNGQELRCCLGHLGKTCGIADSFLLNVGGPSEANSLTERSLWPKSILNKKDEYELKYCTRLADKLMTTNDDITMSAIQREEKITKLGLKAGIQFKFEGEYLPNPIISND